MNQIVNGAVYDTKNATKLCRIKRADHPTSLWRTTSGKYFRLIRFTLVDKINSPGGPWSEIEPITDAQAYRDLHDQQEITLLRRHFPDQVTDA